jgi:hypothetical protein
MSAGEERTRQLRINAGACRISITVPERSLVSEACVAAEIRLGPQLGTRRIRTFALADGYELSVEDCIADVELEQDLHAIFANTDARLLRGEAPESTPNLTLNQEMEWFGQWCAASGIVQYITNTFGPYLLRLFVTVVLAATVAILGFIFCEHDGSEAQCGTKILFWIGYATMVFTAIEMTFKSLRRSRAEYRERMARELENSAAHQGTA